MNLRSFNESDLTKITELHERYYSHLELPDFTKMLLSFIVEDNDGSMIIAGCVQKLAEVILVTDKSKSPLKIGRSLKQAQLVSMFACQESNIRELVAFVDESDYKKHLIQHGFIEREQVPLTMRVKEHGQK